LAESKELHTAQGSGIRYQEKTMKSRLKIISLITLCLILVYSALLAATETKNTASIHAKFDSILKAHVKAGIVDYDGLKANEELLDSYIDDLGQEDPSVMDRNNRLAFWINAYNAYTLKLILNHYPGIKSIKDIPSAKRWEIKAWKVNGRLYSLDYIEHKILRKMDEPRIHFTIVCASFSCPDLRNEVYSPSRLEEQLEDAALTFLSNTEKGMFVSEEKGMVWGQNYVLHISPILRWFGEDFEKEAGSVVDFVLRYASGDTKDFIIRHRKELKIKYLDYDWTLNNLKKE